MISSTSVALLAFALSAAARVQIMTENQSFFNAGIQGCISAESNEDGAAVVIHNCNNENVANHDVEVSFYTRQDAGPQPIKVFGDKCIDVTGGVNADGTKLQIWTCDAANANQKWISVKDDTFRWSGTDKCIDITGGSMLDGTPLQIWTCDGNNSNQKWRGGSVPDTTVAGLIPLLFSPSSSSFCIAATSDADGAEVALVPCIDTDFHNTYPNGNITWLTPQAPLSGPISTFNNKCLDVPNGSAANGVKLQIWTCAAGNTNQRFHKNNGQIEWAGTGKCLDLTDGVVAAKTPIQLWDCGATYSKNQQWFV